MDNDLTYITSNNQRYMKSDELTPKKIIEFLNDGALFRNFKDVLNKVYQGKDLYERLTSGLIEITKENGQSVARKVRNWLNGSNVPKSRETLFQICYILELDESSSNSVLSAASDTGIHYRNPRELIYAYGIRNKLSFHTILKMADTILAKYEKTVKDNNGYDTKKIKQTVFTQQVKDDFFVVKDEKDLNLFFDEYYEQLGVIHETAYLKFIELLDKLLLPTKGFSDFERKLQGIREEKEYSIEQVVDMYLRLSVPFDKKTSNYSLLQKAIKKNWPGESDLQKMRNKKVDVSRKTMILLYLVTDALDDEFNEDEYYLFEEDTTDANEMMEVRLNKMNLFLEQYGMNKLDFGNPFDCLIIYAMKTQYDEFASDKMAEAVKYLYENIDNI